MEYAEWAPGPDLQTHVRCIWSLRHSVGPSLERILPDASPEIIFNFGPRFRHHRPDGSVVQQPDWFLVGQLDRAMRLESPAHADVVGVRLRPDALPALFPVSAHELTGESRAIDDVVPVGDDTWCQAAETASVPDRVEAVRIFLRRRLATSSVAPDPLVREVLDCLRRRGGAIPICHLAALVGRSRRVIERRVRRAVGLSPKTLARILRLQRVTALERSRPNLTWAALAHRCGYADQAHLVREFRRIVGVPPTAFLRERHPMNDLFTDGSAAAFVQEMDVVPTHF